MTEMHCQPASAGRSRFTHRILSRACIEVLEQRRLLAVSVESMSFNHSLAPHQIVYDFSGNVQSSLSASDLHLENLSTATTIATILSSYGSGDVAKFTPDIPAGVFLPAGVLPSGNYQSTIFADAVIGPDGLPMSADADFNFHFLLADIAGFDGAPPDRQVGLPDYNKMNSHWGQQNVGYSNGDFNYDGTVNLQDYNIVAGNFGGNVPELPAPGTLEVGNGPGQLALTWNLGNIPADATNIRIQRSTDGQVFTTYATLVGTTATSFVDDGDSNPSTSGPGLPPGSRFFYRVRAIGGTSGGTAYTPKKGGNTVMPPPSAVSAEAVSASRAKVNWTDTTGTATRYDIELSDGQTTWIISDIPVDQGSQQTYTLDGLLASSSYTFKVRAWGPGIESVFSLPSAAIFTSTQVLYAPSDLVVTELTSSKVWLQWRDNSSNELGFYGERSFDGPNGPWTQAFLNSSNNTIAAPGSFAPGTPIWLRVRAYGAAGNTEYSNVVATQTIGWPSGFTATILNPTEMDVTWSYPHNDETKFLIDAVRYNPYHAGLGFDPGKWPVRVGETVADVHTFRASGLVEGQLYKFRATAVTDMGVGAAGESTTPVAIKPNAPTGLTAASVNQSTINVSWTDNSQGNNGYVVRVYNLSGQLLKEDRILAANLTRHTVSISGQSSYRIDVLAVAQYATGQSIDSDPATTTANMPSPTSGPTVSIFGANMTEATGGGSFTLARTGSTASSLAVQLYQPFGTAEPGVDFTAPGTSFTIPAGKTSEIFPVSVLSDYLIEKTEHIYLGIKGVSNYFVSTSAAWATLLIDDNGPRTEFKPLQLTYTATDATKFNEILRDGHILPDGSPDLTQRFGPIHWKDGNDDGLVTQDGQNGDILAPITYARSGINGVPVKPRIDVKFKVINPDPNAGQYKIRGDGPGFINFPVTNATVEGGILSASVTSTGNIPEFVITYSSSITWEISAQGGQEGTWRNAGTTTNTAYITNIDLTNPVLHTVLDIGCRNATLLTNKTEMALALWTKEFTHELSGVKRADGTAMKFWGPDTQAGNNLDPQWYTSAGLVKNADGRCEAWARLLIETLCTQGWDEFEEVQYNRINANNLHAQQGNTATAFTVKNIPGQGMNPPTQASFPSHAIVKIELVKNWPQFILDPSYGLEFMSEIDWENSAVNSIGYAPAGIHFNQPGDGQDTTFTPENLNFVP